MSPLHRTAVALAIVTSLPGMAAIAHAEPPLGNPAASSPYAGMVADAARQFGIPAAWIWAVMRAESHGDPHATSKLAGAMGLMQLMPETYAGMRVRYGLGADPYDPHDNIIAGAAYLREMFDRYGSPGFLAAYNAGPGRYDDYLAGRRPLPLETVGYLTKLTPIIGGQALSTVAAAPPPDPLAWTRGALFTVRSGEPLPVAPVSVERSDRTEEIATNAPAPGDAKTATSPSTRLFIPLSGPSQR
jgi:soluble lytic murein transglycosylase-like protein